MNQGPRCVRLMEKSGGRKSRATVPLIVRPCPPGKCTYHPTGGGFLWWRLKVCRHQGWPLGSQNSNSKSDSFYLVRNYREAWCCQSDNHSRTLLLVQQSDIFFSVRCYWNLEYRNFYRKCSPLFFGISAPLFGRFIFIIGKILVLKGCEYNSFIWQYRLLARTHLSRHNLQRQTLEKKTWSPSILVFMRKCWPTVSLQNGLNSCMYFKSLSQIFAVLLGLELPGHHRNVTMEKKWNSCNGKA